MRHVIIGGGPAGIHAVETIKSIDPEASITLISDEPAYARMALPYYLAQEIPEEHVLLGDDRFFEAIRVEARLGQRVANVSPQKKQLALEGDGVLPFDTLLIATGSSPTRPLIPGIDGPRVTTLWTLEDCRQALDATSPGSRVVLIGAGFIGFIVLNALYKKGCKLTVIEIADQILPRMLDRPSARLVEGWLKDRGVTIHTGAEVSHIGDRRDGRKTVRLKGRRGLTADLVIVATGIRANTGLTHGSGITVAEGIVVNDRMQTNFPFIYAAGDVAQGPDLSTGQQAIHAIQPTAVDHGRVAGANMAGRSVQYPGSLLMNVLDVAGLHCSSFGLWRENGREAMTLQDPGRPLYRKLLWEGNRIVGAILVGPQEDTAMLNDIGMVKGLIQTKIPLGPWKHHLEKYPFDIRRPYVASQAADRLLRMTTLGRPSLGLRYRYRGIQPQTQPTALHQVFMQTRPDGSR